ncbi:MAG: glycosyltransferase [Paludibacter sp.]|jgi:glycosyltransferase involved in cell wall biosynthesis|nr:glycosyltransferase [Paludibacter sp.]
MNNDFFNTSGGAKLTHNQQVTKDTTLVSVLIPCYNTANYLHRCLDSIVNQTLREIEIICINDASTDNSAQILQKYAESDNRIKVITFSENRGVAVARNVGIQQAQGEYLGFVDSDDYVDLNFYEKLYFRAKNADAEVVKAQVSQLNTDNSTVSYNIDIKLSNKTIFTTFFWLAIYKRELIQKNNIRFLEGFVYAEDRIFPLTASYLANKMETVSNTCYHYIRRNDSTDSLLLNKKKIENYCACINKIFAFINNTIDNKNDYLVLANRLLSEANI